MTSTNKYLDITEIAIALRNENQVAIPYGTLYGVHDEHEVEFLKEMAVLKAKYQNLYQPLYAKRYEIVNGLVEVHGTLNNAIKDHDDGTKGIPNFWLTVLKNNEVLAHKIFKRDEELLQYLQDIKWSMMESPKGFKLEFFFNKNPYFKNSILTKIYHMIDGEEPILEKATGTEIEWYPGKCLTPTSPMEKLVEKKANFVSKSKEHKSFFHFFSPPEIPARRDNLDEESADKFEKYMEQDYDIGTTIRDKIIPHAIKWFTGEAQASSYDHDGDEDSDDEESNDEDYSDEESND
ncbi:hypothetical protein CDL15_Pgr009217 [Punica granatum]|uniref:Nucleosome assembly protein 12-like n=1 Tax=Punica granatum TaxID=22663 RepID=A0A218WX91_PUNGR|nr:hypothetical protein CDL15_Pgr009217 [Punica granatum]